jgi:hypothetical protein
MTDRDVGGLSPAARVQQRCPNCGAQAYHAPGVPGDPYSCEGGLSPAARAPEPLNEADSGIEALYKALGQIKGLNAECERHRSYPWQLHCESCRRFVATELAFQGVRVGRVPAPTEPSPAAIEAAQNAQIAWRERTGHGGIVPGRENMALILRAAYAVDRGAVPAPEPPEAEQVKRDNDPSGGQTR